MTRDARAAAPDLALLRDLCTAHGPSGHEEPVQAVLRARLSQTLETTTDVLGNLTATAREGGVPQVVVAAHCDQVGYLVTGVDEDGYVVIDPVGLVDEHLTEGRALTIMTRHGPLQGIGVLTPPHLRRAEGSGEPTAGRRRVDVGARTREEAAGRVTPGDPLIVTPGFTELGADLVAAQALDDRAGVYVAARALEFYQADPGRARLDVVSTVSEETVKLGARGVAMALRPACSVVVDVEHAADQPGAEARACGGCVLGGGPVLARGSCSNKRLLALAQDVAGEEDIPFQVVAASAPTYSDADALQGWPGCANLNLGIPLRYMHSPLEVCSLRDLEHTALLLAALTRRIGEVYEPRLFLPVGRPDD